MSYRRERRLSQEHWQDIADPRSDGDAADSADLGETRRRIVAMALPELREIISEALTPRQREVWRLYHFSPGGSTQQRVGEELSIRQPTVSQHLTGKVRDGRKIGGALRRVQACIRKRIQTWNSGTPGLQTLEVFDALLGKAISRRTAQSRFDAIAQQ